MNVVYKISLTLDEILIAHLTYVEYWFNLGTDFTCNIYTVMALEQNISITELEEKTFGWLLADMYYWKHSENYLKQ